jgi:hypothetical protein
VVVSFPVALGREREICEESSIVCIPHFNLQLSGLPPRLFIRQRSAGESNSRDGISIRFFLDI